MDVRNCKDCGKMFNYIGGPPLCTTCLKKLDDKFAIVKEYIYDNPGVDIQQVSQVNEVSVQQIKKWIRDEKLSFSEDSQVGLECESCGTMIRTGRFCALCKDKMASTLHSIYHKEEPPQVIKKNRTKENPKMRFLDS